MPITLLNARNDLRSRLNETSPALYADTDLNRWLNDGCRDISRKAKALQEKASITIFPGVQQYLAPQNMIEFHRAEYLPTGSTNTYPLEPKLYAEMDALIGGGNWQTQSFYPSFITQWREPPNTYFLLFSVPSSAGVMNVYYYRTATTAAADTVNLDVPEGWWDLAILFALYSALFKILDPRWKDIRALYEDELAYMISAAQAYTDAVGSISFGSQVGPFGPFGAFGGYGGF